MCLSLPDDDVAAVGGIRRDDELRSDDGSDGGDCGGSDGGSGRCRPEQEGRLRRKLAQQQRSDLHPTRRSRYLATSEVYQSVTYFTSTTTKKQNKILERAVRLLSVRAILRSSSRLGHTWLV